MNLFRLILCLWIALLVQARAVDADCIIHWEGITQGTFDHATAPTGTAGDYDSWGTGTRSRFTVAANDLAVSWPNPVVVGETTYTTMGSNVLVNDVDAGGDDQYISFILPGGAGAPSVSSLFAACFVRFDTSNDSGGAINLDLMIFDGPSGGSYTISQLQMAASDGEIKVSAHTNSGQPSGAAIEKNKVYLMTHYRDMVNEELTVNLYDPEDNFSLASTATVAIPVNENCYLLRFPSGYIGDPPGSITFGDVVLIYEPTEQQMIDMVTPIVPTQPGNPSTSAMAGMM
jgi:hypothetical protein